MEYVKMVEIISKSQEKGNYYFTIILSDKTKVKKRLFVNNENIYEFKKRSSRYGYIVSEYERQFWVDIKPCGKLVVDDITLVRKFLRKTIEYLSKSGFWVEMKESFTKILELSDDDLNKLITDFNYRRELGYSVFIDSFLYSAKKGVVSINYFSDEKQYIKEQIKNYINIKSDYNYRWRKGYDNSISISCSENGNIKGWYATEYKNCGNGHYYYMLDESHAIFGESD